MKVLTKDQVLSMHLELINEYGGAAGVRDEGLLDSALNAPFQTFDGEPLFPTLIQRASRLCYGLVANHPFVDGNKRIGAHVMLTFLSLNGLELTYSQDELISVVLGIASGKVSVDELVSWVRHHEVE